MKPLFAVGDAAHQSQIRAALFWGVVVGIGAGIYWATAYAVAWIGGAF